MGSIAAALNAAGGTLASQWKEYFLSHMLLSLHGFRRLFCCAFRLFANSVSRYVRIKFCVLLQI